MRFPIEKWSTTTVLDGMTVREAAPPGPDRDRVIAEVREHCQALASRLGPAVEELRALVAAHEPVELLNSVAVPTSTRLYEHRDSYADSPETVSWPAKIEYLAGVALSMPPGAGSTPTEVTDRVMELVSDVFDAVHGQQMLDGLDRPRISPALDQTVFLLQHEHLIDRMPGYAVHLERIDAEVFDRHRDYYVAALGSNPADVTRVVRRRTAAVNARFNAVVNDVRTFIHRDPERAAIAVAEMQNLWNARTWTPEDVSADTGIDAGHIGRMLNLFATAFGAQPNFRLPTHPNLIRTHPAIDLGDGAFFVPDAWTLLTAVHDRLTAMGDGDEEMMRRYRRHREAGHQRLVAGALRAVFSDSVVRENQHYLSATSGPGEVDVLVAVKWPLIVEAKAHGLTPPGRRGVPQRVQRVAGDVLDKALQQTGRAAAYIIEEGQRGFATNQGGSAVVVLPRNIDGATEIIVTFERIDPFATAGPALVQQRGRPVWIVSIADLLMVTDVLADPVAFHHYARTRATMATQGILAFMESDALGGYLVDRLVTFTSPVDDTNAVRVLGYTSDAINDYFTAVEFGHDREPPPTGVPPEITAALAVALTQHAGLWTRAVDAVMQQSADRYRKWRRFRRRHRDRSAFPLTPNVHVVTDGPDAGLSVRDDTIVIHVPSAASRKRRTSRSGSVR